MNYRSISDLSLLILNNISKIPHDIDLIVGIPRSGLLVANYIALLMNKPLSDFEGLFESRILSSGRTKNISQNIVEIKECKKILIVDDSVSSGTSILNCRKRLSIENFEFEIVFLAAYVLPSSKNVVDIFFEILPDPRLFEWNIFHQPSMLKKMCFDLDGVLCDDPTRIQNDDGENYIKFIKDAPLKIKPIGTIGFIVTSRLEKYRAETSVWLKSTGIEYNELVMLNATAEERAQQGLHAKYKAEYYKNSKAILFIESEKKQAIEISNIAKKPVFCIEDGEFYAGDKKYEIKYESKYRIRSFFRKFKLARYIYSKMRK